MYVPDRSKTKEMCDQVIIENGGMLRFIPIHLNNINLDNDNVYYYDPGTIIHVQIMA